MHSLSKYIRRFLPFILLLILGAAVSYQLMDKEWTQMQWEIPGVPDEYPLAQKMRPWLISIGCFIPAFVALIYSFCSIMDRYVTRLFLSKFFLCTIILSVIFILGDFTENASDLGSFDNPLLGTLRFYALQMPMVLNLILPYTLLLGALWTLSKLSSSSELTGMLQSGRSLLRLASPILVGSCFIAVYFGIFGFHWAPNATLYRKLLFSSLSDSKKIEFDPYVQSTRFRNDLDNRIWNIRIPPSIDKPNAPLTDVHIEQFSSPGNLAYELFADSATWDPANRQWTFVNAIFRKHPSLMTPLTDAPEFAVPGKSSSDISFIAPLENIPEFDDQIQERVTIPYVETPWQLISSTLRVDSQGTPEIKNQLISNSINEQMRRKFRTELHVRRARIFSCLILAFIAIPSAITFQRRSPMKGIGIAIFLAAAMLLLYEVCSSLASYGLLTPWLGAWLPNIIYSVIAIYLFQSQLAMRSPLEWLKEREKEQSILRSVSRQKMTS